LRGSSWQVLTFHQCVLICRGGAGQHTQLGPDLIQLLLFHLQDKAHVKRGRDPPETFCRTGEQTLTRTAPLPPSPRTPLSLRWLRIPASGGTSHAYPRRGGKPRGIQHLTLLGLSERPPPPTAEQDPGLLSHLSLLVADEPVELLPLQAQEVLPWQQDATFGGDGTGGVDVVPRHHPDSDPGTLALRDGVWHLEDKDRVRGAHGQSGALCFGSGYPRSQAAPLPSSLEGSGKGSGRVRILCPPTAQLGAHAADKTLN